MSGENKKQIVDGNDNYGQGIKNAGKAAKRFVGATKQGAKASANAATATVNAGVKTGKAVANVAKGAAIGGPWGAIISAAWSMRHTLFKIIAVICLVLLIVIIAAVSLPLMLFDRLFGNSQTEYSSFNEAYSDVSYYIGAVIDEGYENTREKANDLIVSGGYDSGLSVIIRKDFDKTEKIRYVLCAYSVSVDYDGQEFTDLLYKLESVKDELFVISVTEKTEAVIVNSENLEYETVIYAECEIVFSDAAVLSGFSVDPDERYMDSNVTKGEMMEEMIKSLNVAEKIGI